MKHLLFKLRVCWTLLTSKGFILVPSKTKDLIQVKLGPKGELLGVNAAGNTGVIFGCTIFKETPLDLHEGNTWYPSDTIKHTVQ